jgi:hypothetical protein
MCTVTINIDEAKMRRINPELTSKERIGQWLQQRVDELMEDYLSDYPLSPCSYTKEEMMAICDRRMEDLISGRATTIPHEEVMRRMSEKYGFAV